MCGIVGYVGQQQAAPLLLDGLCRLEYRGYDSAGIAVCSGDTLQVRKTPGRLAALETLTHGGADLPGTVGIGHTRWATHGEPSDVNSHPHSTPRVSIVHNGIIENYGLLKERLAAKGYTFQSETDTEVLVKLIDSCYTGDPLRALQQALSKVRGSYALAVLFFDYPDTIFAVKRESPLIVGWGEGENFIASDIPALLKYTRKYSVLEEGDMAVCTAEGIRFYNEFGEPVERRQLTADWDMEAAEKGGYPHFMLKEINEQPAAITATVSPRVEDGMPELRIPALTDEVLRGIGRVHLVGCGTAMHAGMVGKSAIEALARVRLGGESENAVVGPGCRQPQSEGVPFVSASHVGEILGIVVEGDALRRVEVAGNLVDSEFHRQRVSCRGRRLISIQPREPCRPIVCSRVRMSTSSYLSPSIFQTWGDAAISASASITAAGSKAEARVVVRSSRILISS